MSDRGLCIQSGANTLALYRRLAESGLPGVVELVPADGALLVVLAPGRHAPPELADIIEGLPDKPATIVEPAMRHHIPVRFDGEDLFEVAAKSGHDVQSLIGLLCALTLRVRFLGFQPGFAYLEGLPPALHLPRRANPRKSVPAGSVALGGAYCGIYPASGPGGWHLIGTSDLCLFDPAADPPARLQPGDVVRLAAA